MLSKILNEVSDEKNDDIESIASLASGDYKIVRTLQISHDASRGKQNCRIGVVMGERIKNRLRRRIVVAQT